MMENEVYDEGAEVEDSDGIIDETTEEAMKEREGFGSEKSQLQVAIFTHLFVLRLCAIVTKVISSPQY